MKINTLRHNLKHLRFKIRHKLFLLERKWVCHPFFGKFYPKKSIYRRFIAVVLALIVISSTTLFYLRPQTTEAAWFDDSYAYRQKITFVHNAALSNAAMRLTVSNTNTLITAGKMQTDCDDSRFTDSNGELLRYKLVSGCNSASTVYDVVFPTVLNGTNLAYFYYGNPQAASLSDSSVPTGTTPSGATSFATEEKGLAPVVAYSFDEGYGTIAHSTGSCATCSGTLTNMASPPASSSGWTDNGKLNKALNFDGLNDRVVLSNNQLVKPATDMSVSFWVKLNRTASQKGSSHMFVYKNHTASPWYSYQFYQLETDNKLYFQWINNSNTTFATTSKSALETNRWYHIAYVKSGSAGKIYLNGVDDTASTDNHTGTIFDSNADFSVGGISPKWTDGAMDEVKLYNYALTEAQVKAEMNRGAAAVMGTSSNDVFSDGLIAYWTMDDDDIVSPNILDVSGSTRTTIATKGGDMIPYSETITTVGAGTWTSPSNVSSVIVEAWGGGGAGGQRSTSGAAGGGGGGAYAKSTVAVSPSTGYDYYVGTGGTTGNPGTDGENSTFESTVVVAAGGKTVPQNTITGGLGGTTADSTGDEERNGGDGATSGANGGGGGSSAAQGTDGTDATSQSGATAPTGGGDGGDGGGVIGFPGTQPGGAGGGAKYFFGTTAGGSGGAGQIKFTYDIEEPISSDPGRFAEAFSFDGVNDKITAVSAVNGINSIAFWASSSATTQSIIDLNGSTTYISVSSDTLIANGFTDPKIYIDGVLLNTLPTGSWHHVVITTTTPINATNYVMGYANSDYFYGYLDDVRVYNRVLSPQEISRLYEWAPGPVAHWKMDENNGRFAYDSSGNDYTASTSGSPRWARGKYGSALYFDGTNDYIIGRGIHVDNLTISGWFKTDGAQTGIQGGQIMLIGNEDASYNGIYISNNGRFNLANSAVDQNLLTYSRFDDNKWHHFSAGFENNSAFIYIDGVEHSYSTGSFSGTYDALVFSIGGDQADYFKGYLDDLKVFNYRRTPKQIVSDMNAGHPAVGSPVGSAVGYWKFDEGYGTTANNSGSGGTALNGTLTSMDSPATYGSGWTQSGKFGKALNFDNTDDSVVVPHSQSQLTTEGFTLSAWVNPASLGESSFGRIIDKSSGGSAENGYHLRMDADNKAYIRINVGSSFTSSNNSVPFGKWTHLLVTVTEGSLVTFYINGEVSGTPGTASALSGITTTNPLTIGNRSGATDRTFDGKIDEVKIYNYAISSTEVKTEFNRGASVVMGALATDADGQSTNSAARAYCPPGNTETNCAAGLNPAPVGHWTLDERRGSTARDTSGNGNDGTLTNNPGWTTGKNGASVNFDGVDDHIAIPVTSSTNIQGNEVSLSAWIYATSLNEASAQRIVSMPKNHSVGTERYALLLNSSNDELEFWIGLSVDGHIGVNYSSYLNGWHHVTGVYSNDVMRIYIDGVLVAGPTNHAGTGSLTAWVDGDLEIGRYNTSYGQYFKGKIDDVRIYNYARSQSQVAWDYNRGAPVGHWKFDECQGATAYDSSGNRINGTISFGASGNTAVGTCGSGTTTEMWDDGTSGKYNSSLGFDGTNDYVQMSDTSLLKPTTLTISAWVKPTNFTCTGADTNCQIFAKYGGDNTGYQLLVNSSGVVAGYLYNGVINTNVSSTRPLAVNTWQLVTLTWDGTDAKLYINGIHNNTDTGAITLTHNTTAPTIGKASWYSGNYFNGLIDDVRVYSYPLSPAQVRLLYNENSAVRFAPLTGSP